MPTADWEVREILSIRREPLPAGILERSAPFLFLRDTARVVAEPVEQAAQIRRPCFVVLGKALHRAREDDVLRPVEDRLEGQIALLAPRVPVPDRVQGAVVDVAQVDGHASGAEGVEEPPACGGVARGHEAKVRALHVMRVLPHRVVEALVVVEALPLVRMKVSDVRASGGGTLHTADHSRAERARANPAHRAGEEEAGEPIARGRARPRGEVIRWRPVGNQVAIRWGSIG